MTIKVKYCIIRLELLPLGAKMQRNKINDVKNRKKEKKIIGFISNVYDSVGVLVTAVIIITFFFTFVFRVLGVNGESMEPTLHNSEWIFVSQYEIDYKPKYGDVVVVSQPNYFHENLVKRVIATEGQTVDINFEKGEVFVDGRKLKEPYIKNLTTNSGDVKFPMKVPKGYAFVMGDNRQNSTDSRSSLIGNIKNDYIMGKVKYKFGRNGFKKVESVSQKNNG